MKRFEDRVVLVTGATGGIGTEICGRLASEGAVVVVADLPGTPLDLSLIHISEPTRPY